MFCFATLAIARTCGDSIPTSRANSGAFDHPPKNNDCFSTKKMVA